ncbi:methylthioadenosine phosphorylase [Planoprotostelium fungivorum]|uniref:Methylthioadenosine phosphorylase n=1 Tax=Planoprotostelium fungivorum TaxID=1890364 RepID=A0A2P6MXL5_9EUKA|nr:methylthioadenosine phosphorylase [Planoprotostelium fungivorum]
MTTPLGIIGGSSLLKSVYFQGFESRTVQTRFDPQKEYSPPHLINKQAIVQAMYDSGVRHVIAFGSVGSLDPEKYPFGTLLVADDFFNPSEIITVFNDARAHFVPEMRTPYREKVFSVVKQQHDKVVDGGTYAQTLGPRFETKSEIRFLKSFADVVGEPFRPLNIVLTSSGMTAAHEFILCSELKIEYALICMIDNVANGLATKTLTLEEVRNGSTELIDQNFQFHQGVALNQQTIGKDVFTFDVHFIIHSDNCRGNFEFISPVIHDWAARSTRWRSTTSQCDYHFSRTMQFIDVITEEFNDVSRMKKNARYIPTYRFINFMPNQQMEKREIEFKNFSFFYRFIIRDDKLIGSLSASGEEEIAWKIGTEKVKAVDRAEKRGWKADLTPEGESCCRDGGDEEEKKEEHAERQEASLRGDTEHNLCSADVLVPTTIPSSSSDNAPGRHRALIDLLVRMRTFVSPLPPSYYRPIVVSNPLLPVSSYVLSEGFIL